VIVACAVIVAILAWGGPSARAPSRRLDATARPVDTGPTSLSAVLLLAAAQLRAGAAPTEAWRRALGTGADVVGDVPSVEQLMRAGHGRGPQTEAAGRASAVVLAAGAAQALGAPLATVLERVAVSVAADEEAAGELHAALAGPRATARVLSLLPVLGLAVSGLIGADPVGVVLGGGLGSVAAVLGVGLLLLGRLWTRALLARAGSSRASRGDRSRAGSGRRLRSAR
jgi:tight adherence protein B